MQVTGTREKNDTVMTYAEWENLHNKIQLMQEISKSVTIEKNRQRVIYFIKQKLIGLVLVLLGAMCFLFGVEGTISLFIICLGLCLMITKEKAMTFKGWDEE